MSVSLPLTISIPIDVPLTSFDVNSSSTTRISEQSVSSGSKSCRRGLIVGLKTRS